MHPAKKKRRFHSMVGRLFFETIATTRARLQDKEKKRVRSSGCGA